MAKLLSRYETVQFSDLHHFVRFLHEAMGQADLRSMLLIATRIVTHPSEFHGFPREFTPAIIRKYFPVTCNACHGYYPQIVGTLVSRFKLGFYFSKNKFNK